MANDLNQCQFIGRLGKDPEIKYMPNGDPVANMSIACGWKGKDKEGTEWVRIVAFGKLAEIMGKYLRKGSQVFIQGSLRTRKWQGQDGSDRYTTEIVADKMQMLDSRGDQNGAQQQAQADSGHAAPSTDFDDSVPF